MDVTLWPWQRIPESWRCAECQKPATRYHCGTGVLIFGCDDHEDTLGHILMDRFQLGMISGGPIRHLWSYWLHTRFYILKRTFWPPERRLVQSMKAQDALIREVLQDVDADLPSVIERFT
jgi:hypothetical protein